MNLSKTNAVAFKGTGFVICAGLAILAVSIALHHLYVKAGIALVAAAIVGMLNSNKPTFISWLLLLGTLLVTISIVGLLDKL